MQDNNLYRPPQSSLLANQSLPPRRVSAGKRFLITLLWAFPIFAVITVWNAEPAQWLTVIAGSFIIAVFCGIIAMLLPVRHKSIFVTTGILAGFALALLTASH